MKCAIIITAIIVLQTPTKGPPICPTTCDVLSLTPALLKQKALHLPCVPMSLTLLKYNQGIYYPLRKKKNIPGNERSALMFEDCLLNILQGYSPPLCLIHLLSLPTPR